MKYKDLYKNMGEVIGHTTITSRVVNTLNESNIFFAF